jgi:hypothetical protein
MNYLILLLGLLLSIPSVVLADACDADRSSVCGDTTAGQGHVYDCLQGRFDRISPTCARALQHADVVRRAVREYCMDDAQQWCAQYSGGGPQPVIDCLKNKQDKLHPDCMSAYRQFQAAGFNYKS